MSMDSACCVLARRRMWERDGMVLLDSVSGLLSVARSLGDFDVGDQEKVAGVSAAPDVSEFMLDNDHEFLLVRHRQRARCAPTSLTLVWPQLACDGVWDVFSSQSAVDYVRRSLKRGDAVEAAVQALAAEALRRGVRCMCLRKPVACVFTTFCGHAFFAEHRQRVCGAGIVC